ARVHGVLPPLRDPFVIEVDAPANVAVGEVPWGLDPWFPKVERVAPDPAAAERILDTVGDHDLGVVVRDAHRYPGARALAARLLSARPEAVVVEMGLPIWRPECGAHVSTYGAAHVNGRTAAELLGAPGAVDTAPVRGWGADDRRPRTQYVTSGSQWARVTPPVRGRCPGKPVREVS